MDNTNTNASTNSNTYSFPLCPENCQPSGIADFSKIYFKPNIAIIQNKNGEDRLMTMDVFNTTKLTHGDENVIFTSS